MKKPISLVLITDVVCNLKCKSCPEGRREEQPSKRMSLDMAEKIIAKACNESRVVSICLYYFNDIIFHPDMPAMIRLCHKYGKKSLLSTNLTIWKNIPAIMEAEPFNIIISLSGWSQKTYEKYHAGGDVEIVKENMRKLRDIRKAGTTVQVSFHRFAYNEHEMATMEQFVKDMGEGWRFVPYGVGLLPLEKVEARWQGKTQADYAEDDLMFPVMDAKALCEDRKHWSCDLQAQTLTVNSEGLVYNCGTRNNRENLRPSFFDSTVDEIMDARKIDPMCISCKAQGLHVYGMQAYSIPRHSLTRKAIEIYKGLGLQGIIPGMTALGIRFARFYMRPQKCKKP